MGALVTIDNSERTVTMAEIDKLREEANTARGHLVWLQEEQSKLSFEADRGLDDGWMKLLQSQARRQYRVAAERVGILLQIYWRQNGI